LRSDGERRINRPGLSGLRYEPILQPSSNKKQLPVLHDTRPALVEETDLVPAGVGEEEARPVGDLNPGRRPRPSRLLERGHDGIDVFDDPDGQNTARPSMVGEQNERSIPNPDGCYLRPERAMVPNDLAPDMIAVEAHVDRDVVRADVEVDKSSDRRSHGHRYTLQQMMLLYLLRHAKSSWDDAALADYDRPLAPRGRKAAKKIAGHVRDAGVRPALVLCSSARRARDTLKRIAPELPKGTEVRIEDRLYGASDQDLLDRLREIPDDVPSAMLVGHNPGLEDFASQLASPESRARLEEKFPTGALATLALSGTGWTALEGGTADLVDFVVPKELA
jgi:phosphohistidine phosphatase